jgi:hypothetical protein
MTMPLDVPPGFPVLITNQGDWWQPYVAPLIGLAASLFVAAAAFAGVVLTNKRTDRRELEKWRRETLGKWCSDVCAAGLDVHGSYTDASVAKTEEVLNSALNKAQLAMRELSALSFRFKFFGSPKLFDATQALFNIALTMAGPSIDLSFARQAQDTDAADRAAEQIRSISGLLGEAQSNFIDVAERTLNSTATKSGLPPIPQNANDA